MEPPQNLGGPKTPRVIRYMSASLLRGSLLVLSGTVLLFLAAYIHINKAVQTSKSHGVFPIDSVILTPSSISSSSSSSIQCSKHTKRNLKPGKSISFQYIHIPKAGGTTIQESLISWGKKQSFKTYIHDGGKLHWDCPETFFNKNPGLVLLGHRGYGYCQRFWNQTSLSPPPNLLVAVVLREPVSRFRSLFDYIMDNDYPQFHEYHVAWEGRDLNDLVVEVEEMLTTPNIVSSPSALFTATRFIEFAHQQMNYLCGWQCVIQARKDRYEEDEMANKNFQLAKLHLEQADVVVVMEDLDDMILQLRFQTLGIVPKTIKDRFPQSENFQSGKKSELTSEVEKIISKWSWRDDELYRLAQHRHQELTKVARHCLREE